jgi:GT2 family glycosyltransferase/glycosyltransferase involved in cell wall biosynthesis
VSQAIAINSVTVLSSVGFHSDGWCEPVSSARIRGTKDLGVGTALIWVKPEEDGPSHATLAIQVDRDEPFIFKVEQGTPTLIGFPVNRPEGKVFAITFSCDWLVRSKGEDTRNLSFLVSRLELTGDGPLESDGAPVNGNDKPTFAKPVWSEAGELRGAINGAPAGSIIKIRCDDTEVGQAEIDASGDFVLPIAAEVSGHQAKWLTILAEPDLGRQDLFVLLDPRITGKERETVEPPVPQTAPAATYAGDKMDPVAGGGSGAASSVPTGSEAALAPLVQALTAQTQALRTLMARQVAAGSALLSNILAPAVDHVSERYGELTEEVINIGGRGPDVIWLGVIDWDFRIQRPQHIARELGKRGCRVLYISIVFGEADGLGRFHIVKSPEFGVYEVKLKLACELPPNIYRELDSVVVAEILRALDEMTSILTIRAPSVVVQYPSWAPVAFGVPGATVIHDCLDLVSGFQNTPREIVKLEEELVDAADVVITTSAPLQEHLGSRRSSELIRNGADVHFFAQAASRDEPSEYEGKVVGYFGAISDWFEVDWIVEAAAAKPEWTFVLVGATDGADVRPLAYQSNVVLLGERPYSELPEHLAQFDVAVIPFKLVELILCTNPVKLYEYMAAGKPVVASAMPEAVAATDLVYIADHSEDFVRKLEQAIDEDSDELRSARMAWACEHDWGARARSFKQLIDARQPKVSIIVLSYMNWAFTEATLRSVLAFSDYDNLEVLVVDNGSTDEIVHQLREFVARDERMQLILNGENLGYAAGNNVGLRRASGDYVVLLNNDTFVTRGWVADLIRPLKLDSSIGLVSPTTNNIGNEQKITISYRSMEEMARTSRSFVRQHARARFDTDSVAFFCAATRRDVLDSVGLLDETFGLGFFEDDDYCQRVLAAGYTIQIVDDVFVHHHLSASFDKIPEADKKALLERNKAIFEERWGIWRPHSYRNAPGFG